MRAIISDIHANLEALTAVLADIERRGIRTIYNLGDTIGYGPDPLACLDHAMRMDLSLLGFYDNMMMVPLEAVPSQPSATSRGCGRRWNKVRGRSRPARAAPFLRPFPARIGKTAPFSSTGAPVTR